MRGRRLEKVNSLILETLAQAIQELATSEIGLITVNSVNTAANLRKAQVYIDVIGSTQKEQEVLNFLSSNRGKLQASLADLELKFTPTLEFIIDHGALNVNRIEDLLNKIKHNGTA